mmetsp:Transcript_44144/g.116698  ORF Transcript_44144/g.116698 Transcript_44144/m.116698 type:complete len:168 (-) Transcript_44144:51-554(-)
MSDGESGWVGTIAEAWGDMDRVNRLTVVFLVATLLLFIGAVLFYLGELYRLLPNWGPVSRFDSDGSEDMLMRQDAMARAARNKAAAGTKGGGSGYGTIGGIAFVQGQTVNWPPYGECKMLINYGDEVYRRAMMPGFPRDEKYFNRDGKGKPLPINDATGDAISQRMV